MLLLTASIATISLMGNAAVEPVSPAGGETVALLPDEQKAVKALPTLADRLKHFADDKAGGKALVNANGGVVTIDVHVDPDGTWDPEQFEALKIVGRKTGTLFQPFNHP